MPFIRSYLRASTKDQDAGRAKDALRKFAKEHGLKIAAWYTETESGATLKRPVLFKLLEDAHEGDVLLLEQVDRLSRLNADDWVVLKELLAQKRIRVVSLDLPTSWIAAKTRVDETTQALIDAVNRMLLDMLAAVSRKDYLDRRRRQVEGIEKARAEGKYKGRKPISKDRQKMIRELIAAGNSWDAVAGQLKCSKSTIKRALEEETPASA